MVNRVKGLTEVFIRINDSGDAVTNDFRDKENGNDEDNRSDDEKRRDIKDYLIMRL